MDVYVLVHLEQHMPTGWAVLNQALVGHIVHLAFSYLIMLFFSPIESSILDRLDVSSE